MDGNLPLELTSFVGRRSELANVRSHLGRGRLVTLLGPGGVGKTRLAVQVATEMRRAMPDGSWFADLATVAGPELAASVIAGSLQIRPRTGGSLIGAVVEYLADKRLLLVLDNCEHVLGAAIELVEAILRGAPDVRVLTTSRTQLGVTGEQVFVVGELATPEHGDVVAPDSAPQFDAVTLFLERAQMARPSFVLDAANVQAVVDICRRVGGLPLAIELAAARLRALSPAQISGYLSERFDVLAMQGGGAGRQQSIRAVLDWSYDLCSGKEQIVWARLGVFQTGFDIEAATAVCTSAPVDGHEILDLVFGLVDQSVLSVEEVDGVVRYQMLELVREYARGRLIESGTERTARTRHAAYYLGEVRAAEDAWFSHGEHAAMTRLHGERDNLRAAVETLLASQSKDALVMATALGFYWVARGSLGEGTLLLERALAIDPQDPGRSAGLWVSGWLALNQGELERGMSILLESADLASRIADSSSLAHAVELTGLALMLQEQYEPALESLDQALDLHRKDEDEFGVARTMSRIGTVLTLAGEADRADAIFRQAFERIEGRGDTWCKSLVLTGMSILTWEKQAWKQARLMATETLRLKRKFNDRLGMAESLEILAWVAAAEGSHREAAMLLGAAKPLWDAVGGASVQMPEAHEACVKTVWEALGPADYLTCINWGKRHGWASLVSGSGTLQTGLSVKSSADPSPLTRRELEVALLVSEGLTNREIAARLVISLRTAEGHVEHILTKLGYSSRTRIAAWVAGQTSN